MSVARKGTEFFAYLYNLIFQTQTDQTEFIVSEVYNIRLKRYKDQKTRVCGNNSATLIDVGSFENPLIHFYCLFRLMPQPQC